jgi:hypothetical protein
MKKFKRPCFDDDAMIENCDDIKDSYCKVKSRGEKWENCKSGGFAKELESYRKPPFSRTLPLSKTVCTIRKEGVHCPFLDLPPYYDDDCPDPWCGLLRVKLVDLAPSDDVRALSVIERSNICRETFPNGIRITAA